jgi:alpha-N-arabinofuranosidase
MPIRQGVEYRGYVWMKTGTFTGTVSVALEADVDGGQVYDQSQIANVAGDWTRYSFALRPAASDSLARFAILFNGEGSVWIDQVSLIPGDAVDDVRADVFDRVKELHPAFIRWPGGNVAQDYHWQWGVGPRDTRPTWINLSWRNELEPGDFGTNEFIRFARNAGAEPSITVNVEGRGATVDEAAAWVEYCNGPSGSKYGAMRVRDGHPEPYRVKYWEIGNEIWGDWVRGHSDAETYARNLGRYVAAMRAVDPSIEVIAVGDNDMAWNRTVLQRAGVPFEYLAIHHYYGRRDMQGDLNKLTARPLYYERFYGEMETLLRQLPADRRPKLAINEWGLDLPESQQYSVLSAVYAARLMNVFERRSDLVAMSAVSDLVNGWPGGIIQAGRQGVFVTPIYLVNRLYASRLGAERLKATVDAPVDAVASRSKDGKQIYLKAVNTDLEQGISLRIRVSGVAVSATAAVERVTADSVAAVNGFATPEAVRTTRESVPANGSFSLDLPRHSVAVVTLTVAR